MRSSIAGFLVCPLLLLGTLAVFPQGVHAQSGSGGLVPETTAMRHGLTRSWFAQAEINAQSARLATIGLYHDTLFVTSDHGLVQAWNAETGEKLWSEQVGNGAHPTSAVGASESVAAVTYGTNLYLFERATGKSLGKRALTGVPAAPPAIAGNNVYIPMRRELMEVHEIQRTNERPPVTRMSLGNSSHQPVVGHESISWATDVGHVYMVSIDGGPRNQVEAYGGVAAPMTFRAPNLFVGSLGGYVYAFNESNGRTLWRFTAEEAVRQAPIVINNAVYVIPEFGGMFSVDANTGSELWHAPQIKQFVAAGKNRVYCFDSVDRFVSIDAKTGARVDVLPVSGYRLPLANWTTDRIYLASDKGLVQCFREIDAVKSVSYAVPKLTKEDKAEKDKAKNKKAEEAKKEEMKDDAMKDAPAKEDGKPVIPPGEDPFK